MEIVYGLIGLLTAACVAYLAMAFASPPSRLLTENRPDDPSERTAVNLRDLEHDLAAGKLSHEDYETARRDAVAELALALKRKKDAGK